MIIHVTCLTSKEIWDKSHTIYGQKSLHLVQKKFFMLKENMSMYIACIEELVSQIRQLRGNISDKMVIREILTSLSEDVITDIFISVGICT